MQANEIDTAFRPETYAQLRTMPVDQIVKIFDSLSPRSRPGGVEFNDPNFWLAELYRRDQEAINRRILVLTRWMAVMTVVITIATLATLFATLKSATLM